MRPDVVVVADAKTDLAERQYCRIHPPIGMLARARLNRSKRARLVVHFRANRSMFWVGSPIGVLPFCFPRNDGSRPHSRQVNE
jgi:hypothetical protein